MDDFSSIFEGCLQRKPVLLKFHCFFFFWNFLVAGDAVPHWGSILFQNMVFAKDILRKLLKYWFSLGTSFKNCSRATAIFACFTFSNILKIELSPARELNLGCFQNCFGFIFRILKIMKFAVLPAWEHSFWGVCAFNGFFIFCFDFCENLHFTM